MRISSIQENLKAVADTQTVDSLVDRVRQGLVRVPSFQRGLRWESKDVIDLFDSIYRGYPIGSLLLSSGKAEADRITVGPITIDAPETGSALWVVDGQQRITALTVGLSRQVPIPTTPVDPWVIYFDANEQEFRIPPKDGRIPASWVPVPQLLDAASLSEWVHNWTYAANASLRAAVFDAGARIRQYQIPLYIVKTNDQQALRHIFHRINNYGKSLKWNEIHKSLFGNKGEHPSTLSDMADELKSLGMGRPEEDSLLTCLLAFKGLDVTRSIVDHYRRDQDVLKSAVKDALPAIRGVLSFLKLHAEIPHLRLLPRSTPLPVLTRFFALYSDPKPRTLDLLTRWTWRTLLSKSFYDERTLLRRGVGGINGDEEANVQNLLSLIPKERRSDFILPDRFDARAANSRIALIGLASLKPINLLDETPLDVGTLIEANDVGAFRKIISTDEVLNRSAANRILLQGAGFARKDIIEHALSYGKESPALRSHAIPTSALEALMNGEPDVFLKKRKRAIEESVEAFTIRLACWGRSDRPSISYLLQLSGGEK